MSKRSQPEGGGNIPPRHGGYRPAASGTYRLSESAKAAHSTGWGLKQATPKPPPGRGGGSQRKEK